LDGGRRETRKENRLAGVLFLEKIVNGLRQWECQEYLSFLESRMVFCRELFLGLGMTR